MWFLLFYFAKPRSHVRILIYRKWPIQAFASLLCLLHSPVSNILKIVKTNWRRVSSSDWNPICASDIVQSLLSRNTFMLIYSYFLYTHGLLKSADQLFVKRTFEEQEHSWTNCVSRAINGFFLFWGEMSEISSPRSMQMFLSLSTLKVVSVRFCRSSQMLRSKDTIGCWIATSLITFAQRIDDSRLRRKFRSRRRSPLLKLH
jgi:hypothetical protein